MSHYVGLDLEDLTPRQLRALLRKAAMSKLPASKRPDKEEDEDCADGECDDNSDLVDLHEEHTGKSNPPKITKDDMPKGVTMPKSDTSKKRA